MKVIIITLFPEIFTSALGESILKRAQEKKLLKINFIQLRDFGIGKRKQVDDTPYGGGAGMVLRVDVVNEALNTAKSMLPDATTILLTPQGKTFTQQKASDLSKKDLILICGRYEGFDERIREVVDEEISVGNYVLTGGEIPALTIIDAVSRLVPGVLGSEESKLNESFQEDDLVEYPQYTKPIIWQEKKVPEILLSGNHAEIAKWRKQKQHEKSDKKRLEK